MTEPQRIDPHKLQSGDRFRRVVTIDGGTSSVEGTVQRFINNSVVDTTGLSWGFHSPGSKWFLLERPSPPQPEEPKTELAVVTVKNRKYVRLLSGMAIEPPWYDLPGGFKSYWWHDLTALGTVTVDPVRLTEDEWRAKDMDRDAPGSLLWQLKKSEADRDKWRRKYQKLHKQVRESCSCTAGHKDCADYNCACNCYKGRS